MLRRRSIHAQSGRCERGQASLLMLAVAGALLVGAVVLFAFGSALGAKGRYQRAADLAAISAAQVMRDLYPRLFEPPFIGPDVPNPVISRNRNTARWPWSRRSGAGAGTGWRSILRMCPFRAPASRRRV